MIYFMLVLFVVLMYILVPAVQWTGELKAKIRIILAVSRGESAQSLLTKVNQEIVDRPWQVRVLEKIPGFPTID